MWMRGLKKQKQTTKKKQKKTPQHLHKQTAPEVMVELQRLHDLIRSKVEIFYMEAEWRDVETT